MDIEPGTVVAHRYKISRPLGRGGMGEVFAAENIRTGRPVALKLLRADSKAKTSAVKRFEQEARAAGSIKSDYVTEVLDVSEDPEFGIVLVFELLVGESLIDRLKRTGPIPFDELHPIIEQVWMGLADAHKVGIIHRDLKPSNVFLEQRPDGSIRVKILDFGISKVPKEVGGETLTEMGQSLGTFSFMPPEQIGKAKIVDHRADIYACATLIYQSLTGQLPYAARNILVMVEMKQKTEARKLSDAMTGPVDPRLEEFVARGLSRDANKRFQSANEALAIWRDLKPASSQRGGAPSSGGSHSSGPVSPPGSFSSGPSAAFAPPAIQAAPPRKVPAAVATPPPDVALVEMTTDETAATLAMPVAHMTHQGIGPAPRAPHPSQPALPEAQVGPGSTQPMMLVRPLPGDKPSSTFGASSPQAALRPEPSERRPGSDELRTEPIAVPGNLPKHPAGHYIPPQVAASLMRPQQPPSQPPPAAEGAGAAAAPIPRVYDDPTSLPASSEKTTVYRPKSSTNEANQSASNIPAPNIAPLPTPAPPAPIPTPRRGIPLPVMLLGFLVVGFLAVWLAMRFLKVGAG